MVWLLSGELLSVAFPRPSGLRIKSAMTDPAARTPPVVSRLRGNDGEGRME